MSLFKKTWFFVSLLLVFVATLSMTGCTDDADTAGKMPSARLVNVIGNYNIVKFNGEVYGVPHGIPIDWNKDDLKKMPGMIVDTSAEKVEKTIKSLPGHDEKIAAAPVLETVIGNYNIVKFNGAVYGVPQGIPIDWHKDDLKKVSGMIVDTSAEKVEKTIKSLPGHDEKIAAAPALETVIGNYNIVKFNGEVYGVPHGIAIDWHKDDLPKVNGMIVGSSVTLVTLSVIGHQISEKLSKLTSAK